MALRLNVPYADKDQVKSLGAIWVPQNKLWTVPDYVKDINPFKNWIPDTSDCIVRKPYLLCVSKRTCWNCNKETPMIALGARNFFTLDYADVNDPENEEQLWLKASDPTLFRYVAALDNEVLAFIKERYPFFKRTYSNTVDESYYANTCTFCGRLQGDFHNHEDFGGAFFHDPYKPAPSYVKLITIDLPYDYQIDARHGSMAYDPIFFANKMQTTDNQNDKLKVIIF